MSLLIKALKQAERKHQAGTSSSEAAPEYPAIVRTTPEPEKTIEPAVSQWPHNKTELTTSFSADVPIDFLSKQDTPAVALSPPLAPIKMAEIHEHNASTATKPLAGEQVLKAPVAAKQAQKSSKPAKSSKLPLIMGISGCVLAVVGWLSWQMWGAQMQATPATPVAMTIASPVNPPPPPGALAQTALPSNAEPEATKQVQDKPLYKAPNTSMPTSKRLRPVDEGALAVVVQAAVPKAASQASGSTSLSVSSTAAPKSEPSVALAVPSNIPKMTRTDSGQEKVMKLNEQAWSALARSDIAAAQASYDEVLKLDKNNTDAWIGLATLAARRGDAGSAERNYRKALDIDPNDAAARAGLVSLRYAAEPKARESQLRNLLENDGSQPATLFALGNALAAQGRWAEAQQSYFNAFSGDPTNADYAFNLAVSLERLRQPGLAVDYYRQSLKIAELRPARFSIAQARSRISVLTADASPDKAGMQ